MCENRLEMLKNKKVIAILICAYNSAGYIERCLNSVYKQDYLDYEVHILDNGSTDCTYEEILKYSNDKTNTYHIKDNVGCARGYQLLLDKIDTDYFMYIDADDFLHEKCLSRLIDYTNSYDPDLIFFNHYRHFSDRDEKCVYSGENVNVIKGNDVIKHVLDTWAVIDFKDGIRKNDLGSHWGTLFKMKYFDERRCVSRKCEFEIGFYEDHCYTIENCLKMNKCLIVDDYLYYLNREGNSVSNSTVKEWKIKELLLSLDIINQLLVDAADDETLFALSEFCIGRMRDLLCEVESKTIADKYYKMFKNKSYFKKLKKWNTLSFKKLISYMVTFEMLPFTNYTNLRKMLTK